MANNIKITIEETELKNEGFTDSGKERYKKTIEDYSKIVFEKAINLGEVDKSPTLQREVTHEHVKGAAYSIANSYGKPNKPKWVVFAQIGQYISTGLVGYFSSQLDDKNGIIGFVISFSVGAILFLVEKIKK